MVALLRTHRGQIGRALSAKSDVYAASTYAVSEALFERRKGLQAGKVPSLLYMHRTGKNSLAEAEPKWKDIETPDRTGFRGLTSLTLTLLRCDPKCFTNAGYSHKSTLRDRTVYQARHSDVVAIESGADDEECAHAPIMISNDAALFPPNTLFCLKKIIQPGEWKAPVADVEWFHPDTQYAKHGAPIEYSGGEGREGVKGWPGGPNWVGRPSGFQRGHLLSHALDVCSQVLQVGREADRG